MKEILEELVETYKRLLYWEPQNELLKLASINPEGGLNFSKEYRKRFVDPRDDFGTFGYARYSMEMKKSLPGLVWVREKSLI